MYSLIVSIIIILISYIWYYYDEEHSIGGLFQYHSVQEWVYNGRYLNYNGYAIFYKDSIGENVYLNENNYNLSLKKENTIKQKKMINKSIYISQKPIVLFIHGFPSFSYDFKSLYTALEDKYHVVAFDMLGFGLSDKPTDIEYSFTLQANITEHLIYSILNERQSNSAHCTDSDSDSKSNLKIDAVGCHIDMDINIIAHDYGVSTTQELLTRQYLNKTKYRINSVLFFNGGLFPETHRPTFMQQLLLSRTIGPVVQHLSNYKLFSKSLNEVFGEYTKLNHQETRLYYDSVCYKGGKYIMHQLLQYIQYRKDHRDLWLKALITMNTRIPIRLVNGPADPVSGIHLAHRYNELLNVSGAKSDVVLLQDSIGHYPQLEDSKNVHSIVNNWLDVQYTE